MKRNTKRNLILVGIIAALATVWILVPSPFVHGMIAGIVLGLGSLVGAFAIFARNMAKKMKHGLRPPPVPTGAWDYAMDARDLDGASVDFADARGHVLVLNFWATWCRPCVAEMPALQRLRDATSDMDVRFALVSGEEEGVVRTFLEKQPLDLPVYLLSGDRPECFAGHAIPATFILDRNGAVAMRHFGAAAWDNESVVTFVRGLAATPQG